MQTLLVIWLGDQSNHELNGSEHLRRTENSREKNKNDPSNANVLVFHFLANLHFSPSIFFNWWHHWMNGISLTELFCGRLPWHILLLSVAGLSLSLTHTCIHGLAAAHIIFVYLIFSKAHDAGFSLDSHQLFLPKGKGHQMCSLSQTLLNLNGLLLQPGR